MSTPPLWFWYVLSVALLLAALPFVTAAIESGLRIALTVRSQRQQAGKERLF